jgi:ankyrin repeat protein
MQKRFLNFLILLALELSVLASPSYARGEFQTDLPEEMIFHTLTFLKPKDLSRLAQTSRTWRRLAEDPRIWKIVLGLTDTPADQDKLVELVADGGIKVALDLLRERDDSQAILQKALTHAILKKRWNRVLTLISAGGNLSALSIPFEDEESEILACTPLIWALRQRDLQGLRKLLEARVDVNEIHPNDNTLTPPLHWAADWSLAAVQLLIHSGANVSAVDGSGNSASHWAAYNNTNSESARIFQQLVQSGAQIAQRGENGNTALHIAATRSNTAVVEVLFSLGADPHIRNSDSRRNSPAEHAARYGNRATLQLFLDRIHHSKINQQNPVNGFTLLHYAAINRRKDTTMVQMLLDAGADPSILNAEGESPLHSARRLLHAEIAWYLAPIWMKCSIQ